MNIVKFMGRCKEDVNMQRTPPKRGTVACFKEGGEWARVRER